MSASAFSDLLEREASTVKRSNLAQLFVIGLALTLTTVLSQSEAAKPIRLITHAAFFSSETHQAKPIDPQVFVRDPSIPAAIGPQSIRHIAGVRPALIDQDAGTTPLVNANGEALGFDLADWLGAKGSVTIAQSAGGKATVSAVFNHLRPGGYYSLFENHFDQQSIGFTPLDGTGETNNFVANKSGTARIRVTASQPLTHANAVLLVYHSHKAFHGEQRGDLGVNAHHQLIVRVPE